MSDIGQDGDWIIVEGKWMKVCAWDLMLDAPDRRKSDVGWRRALVHDQNDGLTINYNDDYPNGVTINGNVRVPGQLTVNGQDVAGLLKSHETRVSKLEQQVAHLLATTTAVVNRATALDGRTTALEGRATLGEAMVPALTMRVSSTTEASINALANVPYSGDVSAATVRVAGGTVQRTLAARFGEVFNVLDFGVVADCNILDWQFTGTDQAARFQAAFDACHANGGGVVKIPKPPNGYAYKFCQTLTIYEHTFVEGETGGNTTGSSYGATDLYFSPAAPNMDAVVVRLENDDMTEVEQWPTDKPGPTGRFGEVYCDAGMRDLVITCMTDKKANSRDGLHLRWPRFRGTNVTVRQFGRHAIHISTCISTVLEYCRGLSSDHGLYLDAPSNTVSTTLILLGCYHGGNRIGMRIGGSNSCSVYSQVIESNTEGGIVCDGDANFFDPYFENNAGYQIEAGTNPAFVANTALAALQVNVYGGVFIGGAYCDDLAQRHKELFYFDKAGGILEPRDMRILRSSLIRTTSHSRFIRWSQPRHILGNVPQGDRVPEMPLNVGDLIFAPCDEENGVLRAFQCKTPGTTAAGLPPLNAYKRMGSDIVDGTAVLTASAIELFEDPSAVVEMGLYQGESWAAGLARFSRIRLRNDSFPDGWDILCRHYWTRGEFYIGRALGPNSNQDILYARPDTGHICLNGIETATNHGTRARKGLEVVGDATRAALRLEPQVPPAAPTDGEMWVELGANALKVQINGVVKTISLT